MKKKRYLSQWWLLHKASDKVHTVVSFLYAYMHVCFCSVSPLLVCMALANSPGLLWESYRLLDTFAQQRTVSQRNP